MCDVKYYLQIKGNILRPIACLYTAGKNVKFYQGDEVMNMEIGSVDFNKEVGERIKQTRQKNNYTREYLAEIADISPKFLYEVETGKKGCSSYVLYRITTALNVRSDYLLNGERELLEIDNIVCMLELFSPAQRNSVMDMIKSLYHILNL